AGGAGRCALPSRRTLRQRRRAAPRARPPDRRGRVMPTASMSKRPAAGRAGLVVDLARPYRVWLVVILVAMLLETIAGPAGPWPLKIIVDYAVGRHAAAAWVVPLLGPAVAADGRALAAMAAISLVLIAVLGGLASYIDSYYTHS